MEKHTKKNLRLFLSFVIITGIFVLLFFYKEYMTSRENTVRLFNEKQLILSKQAALSFERGIRYLTGLVEILADIPPARQRDLDNLKIAFRRHYARVQGFEHILFMDTTGYPLMGYPDHSMEICLKHQMALKDDLKKALQRVRRTGKSYFFYKILDEEKLIHLCILSPVYDHRGKWIGVITGVLDLETLINRSVFPILEATDSYVWIMDTTGVLLFHPIHQEMVLNSVFDRDSSCASCHVKSNLERTMLVTESGVGLKKNKLFEEQLIGYSHAHLGDDSWVIVTSTPSRELTAGIQKQVLTHLLFSLVFSLLVFLGAYWGYRIHSVTLQLAREKEFLERERDLLRERRELDIRYSSLIEQSPDPVFVSDYRRILRINRAFESIFGYSQEEIERNPVSLLNLIGGPGKDEWKKLVSAWMEGDEEALRMEIQLTGKDGDDRDVILSMVKIHSGEDIRIQGVIHDISRIKKLEKEKSEKEQLALLGGMSARIAHEIKNPLASIQAGIQLLEMDFQEDPNRRVYFGKLKEEIQRVDKILRQMLTFARKEEYHFSLTPLSQVIREVLELGNPLFTEKSLSVEFTVHSEAPVMIDLEKMKQVLWNLINNAIQASPEAGKISIILSRNNGRMSLVIADEGPGMPEEILQNPFVPFRSTKTYGTGLGLVISKKIIDQHGGEIRFRNNRPGLQVEIDLPVEGKK